jgi:hypothetical protein
VIRKLFRLDRNVKERKKKTKDPPQNKTQKEKVTQNSPSLGLFTFIVFVERRACSCSCPTRKLTSHAMVAKVS